MLMKVTKYALATSSRVPDWMVFNSYCDELKTTQIVLLHQLHHISCQSDSGLLDSAYCRSRIITMCYDDKTGKINSLSTLPEEMKSTIAELIFGELKELVGEFERIKKPWAITKWVPGSGQTKRQFPLSYEYEHSAIF